VVFTLKARYDLNCVISAIKLQPTNVTSHVSSMVHWKCVLVNGQWHRCAAGKVTVGLASQTLVKYLPMN